MVRQVKAYLWTPAFQSVPLYAGLFWGLMAENELIFA